MSTTIDRTLSRQAAAPVRPPQRHTSLTTTGWLLALLLLTAAAWVPGLPTGPQPALAQDTAQETAQDEASAETPAPPPAPEAPSPVEGAVEGAEEGAAADDAEASDAAAMDAGDREDLRDEVLERYEALPARDGLLLVPRDDVPGISSIEISDGEVAVNGEAVSPTILRSWLGDEAEPLLVLAAMAPEAGRELLRVDATAGAAPAPVTAGEDEDSEAGRERRAERDRDRDRGFVRLGEQFKIGGNVVIEEHEEATEAIAIGGSVIVRGRVRRDVVAVGGNVVIEGQVGGEVVSVPGGVMLGPDAEVGGNITAVGAGVRRDPGADVDGEITEVAVPGTGAGMDLDEWLDGRRHRGDLVRGWQVDEAYWELVLTALLVLLACLAYFIARGPVERVEERLRRSSEVWTAGVVGLLVFLLIVPVLAIIALALIITIVGCLALPLLPVVILVLVVMGFFGYVGVALRLGRWLEGRLGWKLTSPYAALVVGVLLIEIWSLIGESLDIFGGPAGVFAAMFLFVGFLIEWAAIFVGLGAILMNWMDGRRRRNLPPPAPYPPSQPGPGYSTGYADAGHPGPAPPPAPPAAPPADAAVRPPTTAPAEDADLTRPAPGEDREPGDEPGR